MIASFQNSLVFCNDISNQNAIPSLVYSIIFLSFCDFFLSEKKPLKNALQLANDKKEIYTSVQEFIKDSKDTYGFDLTSIIQIEAIKDINLSREAITFIKKIFGYDLSMVSTDAIGSILQNIKNGNGIYENFTSIDNIQKVLRPLFLKDWKQIAINSNDINVLTELKNKIINSYYIDVNAGTGSFLVVAFREIQNILSIIDEKLKSTNTIVSPSHFIGYESDINTSNYARMLFSFSVLESTKSKQHFLKAFNSSIVNSNPLTSNWNEFVPANTNVYVFGNLDYSGARKMSDTQKADKDYVFNGISGVGDLDYASCWLYKASIFLKTKSGAAAFVCTNSILQGEQAGILWPEIIKNNIEICFAYKPFKWGNGCKNTTGVTVVIIGISKKSHTHIVYSGFDATETKYINPYFTDTNVIVQKAGKPISNNLPIMIKGNMPYDGGLLSKISRRRNKILLKIILKQNNYSKE